MGIGWNMSLPDLITMLLAIVVVLTVHEFSHGFAAYVLGDKTAKYDGRLSLNPLKHVDWFGLLALVLFRFGWAKPVSVDPRNFKNPKVDMALTAAAGPISNILLAFLMLLIYVPLIVFTKGTGVSGFFQSFVLEIVSISLSLGFFNLLPIPPLDGSKLFGAFLPDRLYFRFTRIGNVGMIILLILLYTGVVSNIIGPLINVTWDGMLFVATKIYSPIL